MGRSWCFCRTISASAAASGIRTLLLTVEVIVEPSEIRLGIDDRRIVSSFAAGLVVGLKLVARRADLVG
jgi:hypothetical protein